MFKSCWTKSFYQLFGIICLVYLTNLPIIITYNLTKIKLFHGCFPDNIPKFSKQLCLFRAPVNDRAFEISLAGRSRDTSILPMKSLLCQVCSETVVSRCSTKQLFLKTSQNPQENNCAVFSFRNTCRLTAIVIITLFYVYLEITFTLV